MVQILLAGSAFERTRPALSEIVPDADVITVAAPGRFERAGTDVPAGDVRPDIVWVSFDAPRAGLLPSLFERVVQGANTKWMQVFNAGLDGQPTYKQALAAGTRITKSSAQAPPIAEYVLAHAFSLLFPIALQRERQAKKEWRQEYYREIAETRWTLVGFGSIGYEIAKRLKPFGAHLTVVRRQRDSRGLADEVIQLADLPGVLPQTDVVVLACPLNDATRRMANDSFFAALKTGAVLVNIARGALVDSEALKRGLERDQPSMAILDVFDVEPLPAESWMWDHPKIRVTSHTSNAGSSNTRRGDELFLSNLKRYLPGEPLLHEATKDEVGL